MTHSCTAFKCMCSEFQLLYRHTLTVCDFSDNSGGDYCGVISSLCRHHMCRRHVALQVRHVVC